MKYLEEMLDKPHTMEYDRADGLNKDIILRLWQQT